VADDRLSLSQPRKPALRIGTSRWFSLFLISDLHPPITNLEHRSAFENEFQVMLQKDLPDRRLQMADENGRHLLMTFNPAMVAEP
jgi:hypothetical protein